MRSTERPARGWWRLLGVTAALNLALSVHAGTLPDSPALNRPACLANGNWYGYYHGNHGLIGVCLKLPAAISVKMLDSNDDGVVDSNDTISSGVVFIGGHSNPERHRQWCDAQDRQRFQWRRHAPGGKIRRRQPSHHVATNTVSES